jgi:pimeloyl-ACP methyl ester carboxylesterase
MWREIYPSLVEAGYRVVIYDRRGYGRSEEGRDFEAFYTGDRFRNESVSAMAQLVRFLGLDTFHIVGQCEGGVVGVDYAVRFPRQVKSLTTASTLCRSRCTMEAFNRKKFPPAFSDLNPQIQEKYIDWHGPDRAERFFRLCTRYGGEYGRGVFDLRETLASVSCPTLVMYPDRGYFFEVEQGVDFYRCLPDGELVVFARCGHNIHEHYPREYVRQVLRFHTRRRISGAVPMGTAGGSSDP